MKVPQMKTNMKVLLATESTRSIALDANPEAIKDVGLERFGVLTNYGQYGYDNRFYLSVDGRYDFGEVLAYVESLCVPVPAPITPELDDFIAHLKRMNDRYQGDGVPVTLTVIYRRD